MANKPDFETYKKRLKSLKNFREMADIEFNIVVQKKYNEKYLDKPEENKTVVIFSEEFENEVGLWISKEEADEALEQYNKYVKARNIVEVSDLTLLKNLVFYEMQLKRVARVINEEYRKVKAEGKTADVPAYELKTINSINEQIIELKKVLGLAEQQKKDDLVNNLNLLEKKFAIYRAKHLASFSMPCPHCMKMIALKIRTETWDAIKHPFFPKDKVLCNDWAWKLYQDKTITSMDLAKILLGKDAESDAYVLWLEKKIYGIKENPDPIKESGE